MAESINKNDLSSKNHFPASLVSMEAQCKKMNTDKIKTFQFNCQVIMKGEAAMF